MDVTITMNAESKGKGNGKRMKTRLYRELTVGGMGCFGNPKPSNRNSIIITP